MNKPKIGNALIFLLIAGMIVSNKVSISITSDAADDQTEESCEPPYERGFIEDPFPLDSKYLPIDTSRGVYHIDFDEGVLVRGLSHQTYDTNRFTIYQEDHALIFEGINLTLDIVLDANAQIKSGDFRIDAFVEAHGLNFKEQKLRYSNNFNAGPTPDVFL